VFFVMNRSSSAMSRISTVTAMNEAVELSEMNSVVASENS
jgi:hypothetical protein